MKTIENIKVVRLYGEEDLEEVLMAVITEELVEKENRKMEDCE